LAAASVTQLSQNIFSEHLAVVAVDDMLLNHFSAVN